MPNESLKSTVINNDEDGLILLLSDSDNPITQEDLNNLFILSSSLGRINIAGMLLSNGAQINATMPLGDTALTWAIIKNQVDAVAFLISEGINVNAHSISGNTALILAAQLGRVEVIELLIKAGANLDKTNKSRQTALMIAEQGSNQAVTDLLLSVTKSEAPPEVSLSLTR
jgi:ankyrin repeat protein